MTDTVEIVLFLALTIAGMLLGGEIGGAAGVGVFIALKCTQASR